MDAAAALHALAAGAIEAWPGLPPGLDRDTIDAALDGEGAGPEETMTLAGAVATVRTYPPTAGAPFGIRAWFEGDQVVALDIREPVLGGPYEDLLGEPEADAPSGLGGSYRQLVYASRGLTLHVSAGTVRHLYAYAPCTAEQFLASPLAEVEVRRIRRPLG